MASTGAFFRGEPGRWLMPGAGYHVSLAARSSTRVAGHRQLVDSSRRTRFGIHQGWSPKTRRGRPAIRSVSSGGEVVDRAAPGRARPHTSALGLSRTRSGTESGPLGAGRVGERRCVCTRTYRTDAQQSEALWHGGPNRRAAMRAPAWTVGGIHAGCPGTPFPAARILGAANAYQAMREPRAHRAERRALTPPPSCGRRHERVASTPRPMEAVA